MSSIFGWNDIVLFRKYSHCVGPMHPYQVLSVLLRMLLLSVMIMFLFLGTLVSNFPNWFCHWKRFECGYSMCLYTGNSFNVSCANAGLIHWKLLEGWIEFSSKEEFSQIPIPTFKHKDVFFVNTWLNMLSVKLIRHLIRDMQANKCWAVLLTKNIFIWINKRFLSIFASNFSSIKIFSLSNSKEVIYIMQHLISLEAEYGNSYYCFA